MITTVDFGEVEWRFRPRAFIPETEIVLASGGEAVVNDVIYEVGDPVYADLTGNGVLDAAVPITAYDGNAVDAQWYLWLDIDGELVQSPLPITQSSQCGTATWSVTAVDGGIEVHETRRAIGEESIPCSETGTDERRRIVTAVEARNSGEWWPQQVSPHRGFGGVCPIAAEWEASPWNEALYAAPDTNLEPIMPPPGTGVFTVDGWPVYGSDFPGWILVGVLHPDGILGCAWSEVAS